MFISKDKLPYVVSDFLKEYIMPKAQGIKAFSLGFLLPYIQKNTLSMVSQYEGVMISLGIMGQDGKIDIDQAYSAALSALESMNGSVEIMGYLADKQDIDHIKTICMKYTE